MSSTPLTDSRVLVSSAYEKSYQTLVSLSRVDPATFVEFVMTDEETGKPVKLAPLHEEWHEALSEHDRLVIWSHVEAGKTSQVSIGRALWELGKDTSLRIVILSSTKDNAAKIVRALAQYISHSARLKAVFPHLMPARDGSLPWTTHALTVERDTYAKDASIQAIGFGGHIIGARIDLLIIDDLLDAENTNTPAAMAKVLSWIRSSALGRLTPRARVWCVTNAWHPKDAMHALANESGYAAMRCPVRRPDGTISWPERWSEERIATVSKELGALEAGRQLFCRARDDDASAFKQEWIDICIARGEGYELVERVDRVPDGYAIFTGVDLAVQQHAAADLSCFFTILLHPDGARQLLWLEAGKWTGPEIVARIDSHDERFGSIQVVENVAAQDYILQFARTTTRAKLQAFTTGKNKANPAFGVASLAAELSNGQWIIPSKRGQVAREVQEWIQEMLFYNPRAHTGDRLMSAWFSREGARAFERKFGRRVAGQPIAAPKPAAGGVRTFAPRAPLSGDSRAPLGRHFAEYPSASSPVPRHRPEVDPRARAARGLRGHARPRAPGHRLRTHGDVGTPAPPAGALPVRAQRVDGRAGDAGLPRLRGGGGRGGPLALHVRSAATCPLVAQLVLALERVAWFFSLLRTPHMTKTTKTTKVAAPKKTTKAAAKPAKAPAEKKPAPASAKAPVRLTADERAKHTNTVLKRVSMKKGATTQDLLAATGATKGQVRGILKDLVGSNKVERRGSPKESIYHAVL